MEIKEVYDKIEEIERMQWDNEGAHSLEDDLWEAVLEHIASEDCTDPILWAKVCLSTKEFEFTRWYA